MQVIKESQRLFPAAAIGPIRMAAENAELGGYFIPKGTRVQVSQAAGCPCGPLLHAFLWSFTATPLPLVPVMMQKARARSRQGHGMPGKSRGHTN